MDNTDFAGISEAFGSLVGTVFANEAFDVAPMAEAFEVAPMARLRSVGCHADAPKPEVSEASEATGFFAMDAVSAPACRLVAEP